MRILKGILLGSAIFVIFFVFYIIVTAWRLQSHSNLISTPGQGVGADLVALYHNLGFPLWLLLSYAACLIIGCAIVAFWASKGVPLP